MTVSTAFRDASAAPNGLAPAPSRISPIAHRDDIDGLRALAILPVVFFHLKMPFNHGGFLGVDVFFVISGYLITKIVDVELAAGAFSIRRFYERRARRIFPALFAMLAACAAVGSFVLLPQEFAGLGQSIASTTLFASNFFFYAKDNYFSAGSDFEPLLHTWSLAVEEQFYLVFPLLLLALRRRSRGTTIAVLCALALGSLALNAVLLDGHASAAFYLPAPRAWELLLGALLALDFIPIAQSRPLRETLGALGLGGILFSVVFLSDKTVFFEPLAIYACLGAAFLILAGRSSGSLVSRALASAGPAYVGRISYSLYLWHWPLIVLYKLTIGEPSRTQDRLILVAASLAAAALSAEFIEKPFRRARPEPSSRRAALGLAAGAMAAALALGFGIVATDGLAGRFPEPVAKMAAYVRHGEIASMRTGSCFLSSDSNDMKFFSVERCLSVDPSKKNFLLIGDSHAAHLWSGLRDAYPEINFLQATDAGCAPISDAQPSGSVCERLMSLALHDFLPGAKLDGVILSERWADSAASRIAELKKTLAYVGRFQSNVFVVGPTVEYAMPLPRILALGLLRHDPTLPTRLRQPDAFEIEPAVRDAAAEFGARYVSMIATLCSHGDCRTVDDDGAPLEFDYGHLSQEGSRYVGRRWANDGLFEPATARAGAVVAR